MKKYVITLIIVVICFYAFDVYARKTILNNFTEKRQYTADRLSDITTTVPASASSSGTQGQIAYDSDYVYICVSTDTWKRAALSTWAASVFNLVLDDGTSKILLDDGASALIGR